MAKHIGFVIKELREKAGFNQTEFGKKIKITQTSISLIETGKTTPHHKTLDKISEVLKVPLPLIYLLTMSEDDVPESKRKIGMQNIVPVIRDLIQRTFLE